MARRNRTRPVVASVPAPTTRGFSRPGPRPRPVCAGAGGVPRHHGADVRDVAVGDRRRRADQRRSLGTGPTHRADGVRRSDQLLQRRGGIIANPSVFMLGLPGFGKSTCIARLIMGLSAFGVVPS